MSSLADHDVELAKFLDPSLHVRGLGPAACSGVETSFAILELNRRHFTVYSAGFKAGSWQLAACTYVHLKLKGLKAHIRIAELTALISTENKV